MIERLVEQASERHPRLAEQDSILSAAQQRERQGQYGWLIPALDVSARFAGLGQDLGDLDDQEIYTAALSWDLSPDIPARKRRAQADLRAAQIDRRRVRQNVRSTVVRATIEVKPGETGEEIILDIHGDNGGLLIGRRGQTLEALQYILTRAVGERHGAERPQLIVDTENCHERRKKTLEDMALRLGEKAKRQRTTVSIDSLSARDRRIIHLTLEDDPWLTTRSLGQGAYRRLLIVPEGDRKKKEP